MRCIAFSVGLLLLGCDPSAVVSKAAPLPPETPPPDLRTRKDGSDWPRFLGPTGDSISSEKGLVVPWPKKGPRIVWQCRMGAGYSMPAISLGRLFLFDRVGEKARLRCLNAETGERLWSFDYPSSYEDLYRYSNGPRCYPIVDGDRVYTYGVEGMLHCLRVTDGKVLWKIDTIKDFHVIQNFFGVGSTPVIEGDLLIAQVGGSPADSPTAISADVKGNGCGVVAFDKRTGKVRWKITDELASYSVPVLATIDKRRWCFVLARGGLIGFDPANGKVDFHYPWRAKVLESVNAACPVVVGNKVFITETYGPGSALLEVKPGSVRALWTDAEKGARDKSMQCHWNTPVYVDGYLYGCSGRHTNNAELRCIEMATGKVMWSEPNLTRSSLLLVDGHFICQAEDGTLSIIKVNPKKYEEVSRVELKAGDDPLLQSPCWSAPILSHGLLYVRGEDRLLCLEVIPPAKK